MRMLAMGLILFVFSPSAAAQGVELDDFSVFQYEEEVYLSWIIARGNTCNGISIERSADNIHFEEINYIPGVCGSATSPQPYSFSDKHPLKNQVNYYRLELGLQGYSETRQIEFLYVDDNGFEVRPNPASDQTQILFNNPKGQLYELEIYSLAGALMDSRSSNGTRISLNVSDFQSGIYLLKLINPNNDQTFAGRLVVAR